MRKPPFGSVKIINLKIGKWECSSTHNQEAIWYNKDRRNKRNGRGRNNWFRPKHLPWRNNGIGVIYLLIEGTLCQKQRPLLTTHRELVWQRWSFDWNIFCLEYLHSGRCGENFASKVKFLYWRKFCLEKKIKVIYIVRHYVSADVVDLVRRSKLFCK